MLTTYATLNSDFAKTNGKGKEKLQPVGGWVGGGVQKEGQHVRGKRGSGTGHAWPGNARSKAGSCLPPRTLRLCSQVVNAPNANRFPPLGAIAWHRCGSLTAPLNTPCCMLPGWQGGCMVGSPT